MEPIKSLEDILRISDWDFKQECVEERKVKLIGIIFCRPQLPLAQEDIIPNISYYHVRSGRYIDFFFAGFTKWPINDYSYEINGPSGRKWCFDERSFNKIRSDLEKYSNWEYSGGNDLVLITCRHSKENKIYLDLDTGICIQMEHLKRIKGFEVSQLFEKIFKYSENPDHENPVWKLSDTLGVEKGIDGIKNAFLSILPSDIKDDAKQAVMFAVKRLCKEERYNRLHLDRNNHLFL